MTIVSKLSTDSRFWSAVVLLGNAVLHYFVPDFPKEIWAAIDALAAVVIGTISVNGARKDK